MVEGLIYHNYDTHKPENNLCLDEHWPLLLRVWKLGCARTDCPFWLSVKSSSVEIADGVMNLWLIMMDMGCAVYDVVYVTKSLWMSEHALQF